jgi:hypothetical protein
VALSLRLKPSARAEVTIINVNTAIVIEISFFIWFPFIFWFNVQHEARLTASESFMQN